MARSGFFDLLHTHRFWAFDPGLQSMPVFNPLFGFQAITSPEIMAEVEEIRDGTAVFSRSVIKNGSVGNITFSRAAAPWDNDFYDWINHALYGERIAGARLSDLFSQGTPSYRRDIIVLQFTRIDPIYSLGGDNPLSTVGVGPVVVAGRVPARGWMLHNCVPIRYKAGSDFDANDTSVSLMEIEVKPEYITEYTLGMAGLAAAAVLSVL